jgi:hypothetical protein
MLLLVAGSGALIWRFWPAKSVVLLVLANTRSGRSTAASDVAWLKSQVKGAKGIVDRSAVTPDAESLGVALAARRSDEPVIVFVSAPGRIDADGTIVLSANDPGGELKLDDLLGTLKACKSSRKLLVLDVDAPVDDSTSGLPRDDLAGALRAKFAKVKDGSLYVLLAAGAGERSRASEALGRSVFADAFGRALGESAEEVDRAGNRDKVVTTDELTAYVAARVDDWSQVHFGDHQRPTLAARGDGSRFVLALVTPATVMKATDAAKSEATKALPPAVPETKPASATNREIVIKGYPANLKGGWERRDRWRRQRVFLVAPRPFRRLEAALLAAERDWRFGRSLNEIDDRILIPALDQAEKDEREWSVTLDGHVPPSRSLASFLAAGSQPNPTLDASVRDLALGIGHKKPEDVTAQWEALAKDYPPADHEKSFQLAYAVIAAARDKGPRFAPLSARLPVLAAWLQAAQAEPDFGETSALMLIASVADRWPEETLADALEVACDGEAIDARARASARFEDEVKSAAALRHRAEVLLQSRGFAPEEAAIEAVGAAKDAITAIRARFTPIDRAEQLTYSGFITLLELAPYVDDAGAETLADWRAAATSVAAMRRRLAANEVPTVLENDALEAALTRAGAALAAGELSARIRESRDEDRARADEFKTLNALLSSSRPTFRERMALLDAERALGHRLNEIHQGHDFTQAPDAASDEPTEKEDPRREIAGVLLALAGADDVAEAGASAAEFRDRWNRFADGLPNSTKTDRDTLTRIVPLWVASGGLDDRDSSPEWVRRREETAMRVRWLASRYSYEANDLGATTFIRESADAFRALAGGGRPPHFEMDLLTPVDLGREGRTTGTITLTPANLPKETAAKSVRLLKPNDPRLIAGLSASPSPNGRPAELSDVALPGRVAFEVAWNAAAAAAEDSKARPSGMLAQVDWAGRTYSLKIPVSGIPAGDEPEILLAAEGREPFPAPATLSLRPLSVRQAFGLFVRNPAETERTMIVEISAGGSTIRTAPMTVAKGAVAAVKLEGAAKPEGELPELTVPIVARVFDQAGKVELSRKEIAVQVSVPKSYATYVPGTAKYYPKSPSHPERNRLQVQIRPMGIARDDLPSVVTMTLPPEIDPAGAPKEFQPSVALDPKAPEGATLFAEDFAIRQDVATSDCVFYVGVDRDPRVFKFRVNLSRSGAERVATLDEGPAILPFGVPRYLDSDTVKPFDLVARLDNAPQDAILRLSLSLIGANGQLQVDKQAQLADLGQGIARVGLDAASGVVFDVAIAEARWPLKLAGRGHRMLKAELIDGGAGGRKLAERSAEIILDDRATEDLAFLEPAEPIPSGSSTVKVAVKGETETGIVSVKFYLGKPPENPGEKPAGELIAASPDSLRRTWTADLRLKGDERGQVDLTAQFINGIGRVSYKSMKLVVEAADVAMKKAAQTGTIAGVVSYRVPRSGVTVLLLGASGAELKRTKSDEEGKFTFKEVPPGTYIVSGSLVEAALLKGKASAEVKAGETTQADLTLAR